VCCDTVESCTWILVFRKNHVLSPLPSSTVMIGHLPSNPPIQPFHIPNPAHLDLKDRGSIFHHSEACVFVCVCFNDVEDGEII
jgi:hypothetical protein